MEIGKPLHIEFIRKADEHVEVMMSFAGRLQTTGPKWRGRVAGLLAGILLGSGPMVLLHLIDPAFIAYGLPPEEMRWLVWLVIVEAILLVWLLGWLVMAGRRYRTNLMAQITPGRMAGVSADGEGVVTWGSSSRFAIGWADVRAVDLMAGRIEIASEGFVIYVPARAFADEAAMGEALENLRALWAAAGPQTPAAAN